MTHRFRLPSLVLVAALAVTIFAQSASSLMIQGEEAYRKKDYLKSAQFYTEAYKKDSKQLYALYNAACSYALAGRKDDAFDTLEQLASAGFNMPDQLKADRDFESIRSDNRWATVVSKVEENAKKNPPKPMWAPPFKALPVPADASALQAKLGGEKSAVWLDQDVLSFLFRSKSESVELTGGIQMPMRHVKNSDLWVLQLQMPDWEKAIVSYGFVEKNADPTAFPSMKEWRGENAPAKPRRAKPLAGKLIERTIHSAALGEDRKIYVYLPPVAPKKDIPAVFLADGASCKSFAEVLEPLILDHQVRACAIVGVADGGYRGDRAAGYDPMKDFRALEYVPGQDEDRFDRHMKFFTEEVGAYVAKEFGISTRREDRAVTGFSNGGAFSAAAAFRRPEFFGVSMPLSLGVPPTDAKPSTPLPRMYFAGGTLESFGFHTKNVYDQVKAWGAECTMDFYVAGHDFEMWQIAFANLMPKAFPPEH